MKSNKRYKNNKAKIKKVNITVFFGILIVSILMQHHAVKIAYLERGRFEIGGEWLTIPLIFLAWYFLVEITEFFGVVKRYGGANGSDKCKDK